MGSRGWALLRKDQIWLAAHLGMVTFLAACCASIWIIACACRGGSTICPRCMWCAVRTLARRKFTLAARPCAGYQFNFWLGIVFRCHWCSLIDYSSKEVRHRMNIRIPHALVTPTPRYFKKETWLCMQRVEGDKRVLSLDSLHVGWKWIVF